MKIFISCDDNCDAEKKMLLLTFRDMVLCNLTKFFEPFPFSLRLAFYYQMLITVKWISIHKTSLLSIATTIPFIFINLIYNIYLFFRSRKTVQEAMSRSWTLEPVPEADQSEQEPMSRSSTSRPTFLNLTCGNSDVKNCKTDSAGLKRLHRPGYVSRFI